MVNLPVNAVPSRHPAVLHLGETHAVVLFLVRYPDNLSLRHDIHHDQGRGIGRDQSSENEEFPALPIVNFEHFIPHRRMLPTSIRNHENISFAATFHPGGTVPDVHGRRVPVTADARTTAAIQSSNEHRAARLDWHPATGAEIHHITDHPTSSPPVIGRFSGNRNQCSHEHAGHCLLPPRYPPGPSTRGLRDRRTAGGLTLGFIFWSRKLVQRKVMGPEAMGGC